jgi:hypothetical protein
MRELSVLADVISGSVVYQNAELEVFASVKYYEIFEISYP